MNPRLEYAFLLLERLRRRGIFLLLDPCKRRLHAFPKGKLLMTERTEIGLYHPEIREILVQTAI